MSSSIKILTVRRRGLGCQCMSEHSLRANYEVDFPEVCLNISLFFWWSSEKKIYREILELAWWERVWRILSPMFSSDKEPCIGGTRRRRWLWSALRCSMRGVFQWSPPGIQCWTSSVRQVPGHCEHWPPAQTWTEVRNYFIFGRQSVSHSMSRTVPRSCWRQQSFAIKNQLGNPTGLFCLYYAGFWGKQKDPLVLYVIRLLV